MQNDNFSICSAEKFELHCTDFLLRLIFINKFLINEKEIK